MDKYMTCNGFKSYCSITKLGKLYLNDKIHSDEGVIQLYKVVVDNYKLEKENQCIL